MPLSYDYIEKPEQVVLIDQFFSGSHQKLRDAYEEALRLLRQPDALDQTTDVLARTGQPISGFTAQDVDHFRAHWLDPDQALHPWSGPGVGDIMRAAYLDAVNAAAKKPEPVPIETFWVFSPIEKFEMRVSESDTQVTVFALIPKGDEIQFDVAEGDRIRKHGP